MVNVLNRVKIIGLPGFTTSAISVMSLGCGIASGIGLGSIESTWKFYAGLAAIVSVSSALFAWKILAASNDSFEIDEEMLKVFSTKHFARTPSSKRMSFTPTILFIAQTKHAFQKSGEAIDRLLYQVETLIKPHSRRLILTQLPFQSRLVEPLEIVLRENRSINDSVLKGMSYLTDLIPCAKISSTVAKDEFWKFTMKQYSQVIIIAPEEERELWLSLFALPVGKTPEGQGVQTPLSQRQPLSKELFLD